MSFLPENYEAPKATGGHYMKFQDGTNQFRVLGSAIVGYELWINKKPYRTKTEFDREELENADIGKDGKPQRPKHFWAFPVIDYADGQVKILQVTQKSVQEGIQVYLDDADWGDPKEYDLVVKKAGEGIDTTYSVIAKPAKPLSADHKAAWKAVEEAGFNLNALYDGGDPYNSAVITRDEINIEDINF